MAGAARGGAGGDEGADGPGAGPGPSTHFVFDNRVFAVPGAYFSLDAGTREPVFTVPLGDNRGAIPFPTLMDAFGIPRGSEDARLLDVVADALAFVKVIRPGESIPRELLDGTASWSVEDRHRQRARARLWGAALLFHADGPVPQLDVLERDLDEPEMHERRARAAAAIAAAVGPTVDGGDDAARRIEAIAHEYAYVEALRDRVGAVGEMRDKVDALKRIYSKERRIMEEITQIGLLVREPAAALEAPFRSADLRLRDAKGMVADVLPTIRAVRAVRDAVHRMLLDWDEVLKPWAHVKAQRSTEAENMVRQTYRFLARRNQKGTVWVRGQG